ncbi:hypothetical protein DPMN_168408 [Dreissena polymorpha]|uniref:Uncharacterized protein n=1 Tax=Dreissena polymorpha TaxID=45954 RepID=A0A9D4F1Q4_DREPO|nr:hypothetical protein DPMN_168408 [Dreissena polymorpha]
MYLNHQGSRMRTVQSCNANTVAWVHCLILQSSQSQLGSVKAVRAGIEAASTGQCLNTKASTMNVQEKHYRELNILVLSSDFLR